MTGAQTWLDRVASVRELVEAHAPEADRLARMPGPVVDGIVANRLFRPWIPRVFDGEELDLPSSLQVFEAAARIDGAFGWAVTIGVGGGLFAPLLPQETAAAIYTPPEALIAGSGSPSGSAERTVGGYLVAGRWQYASGCHNATWITASCRVLQDGQAVLDREGQPLLRAVAVPRGQVLIHPTWDTLGMRGTGSHDIEITPGTFVPESHTFDVMGAPGFDGPLYRFPFVSIAEASFAAVALGCGQHFLDLFGDLARTKPARAGGTLGDNAVVAALLAEGTVALSAARAAFRSATGAAWERTSAREPVTAAQMDAVRTASVFAAQTAVTVSDRLFSVAGMSALPMRSPIGRAWRDLHTVSQHVLLSPLGYR